MTDFKRLRVEETPNFETAQAIVVGNYITGGGYLQTTEDANASPDKYVVFGGQTPTVPAHVNIMPGDSVFSLRSDPECGSNPSVYANTGRVLLDRLPGVADLTDKAYVQALMSNIRYEGTAQIGQQFNERLEPIEQEAGISIILGGEHPVRVWEPVKKHQALFAFPTKVPGIPGRTVVAPTPVDYHTIDKLAMLIDMAPTYERATFIEGITELFALFSLLLGDAHAAMGGLAGDNIHGLSHQLGADIINVANGVEEDFIEHMHMYRAPLNDPVLMEKARTQAEIGALFVKNLLTRSMNGKSVLAAPDVLAPGLAVGGVAVAGGAAYAAGERLVFPAGGLPPDLDVGDFPKGFHDNHTKNGIKLGLVLDHPVQTRIMGHAMEDGEAGDTPQMLGRQGGDLFDQRASGY
jgi:hypothetical protein